MSDQDQVGASVPKPEDSAREKEKRKSQILIGLSGGPDSTVVAHLLGKQGLNLVGIALCLVDEKFNEYFTDQFLSSRTMAHLENSKKFCERLKIPFYGVDATLEYYDQVILPMVGARLSGRKFNWRLYESRLIMETLAKKSEKLGIDQVTTGHYAKIHGNKVKNEYSLVVASDIPNDQSYLLGLMDQGILSKFFFPLGDLRQSEVQRLLSSFGEKIPEEKEIAYPFRSQKSHDFFCSIIPLDLVSAGTIHADPSGIVVGEHQGIIEYELGKKNLPKENFIGLVEKENVISNIDARSNKIYIGNLVDYKFTTAILSHLHFSPPLDTTKKIDLYAKIPGEDRPLKCGLNFKNNRYGILELKEESSYLELGTTVIFFDREGANARLVGSGVVESNKKIKPLERIHRASSDDEDKEIIKGADGLGF